MSPIIAGKALKGPAAKIMAELGTTPSAHAVARHYRGLIDGLVIDHADRDARRHRRRGIAVHVTDAIMRDLDSKSRLAQTTLAFAAGLRHANRARFPA